MHKELTPKKIYLDKDTAKFIMYVAYQCMGNGISFHLYTSNQILDPESGEHFSGWFAEETKNGPELRAAMGVTKDKTSLGVLAHEFNHTLQFIEKDPTLFIRKDIKKTCKIYDQWGDWLDHKVECSDIEAELLMRYAMKFEWDCEKRTLQTIKNFSLPIDLEYYAKAANAYIYSYYVIKDVRSWYDIGVSRIKEIMDMMPSEIAEFGTTPPDGYKELVLKHCYKRNLNDKNNIALSWMHLNEQRGPWSIY